ncbi:hypothetical protein EGW08_002663 [Elysia chlorotica]|uniref:Uncharacterized protein n=1 Tax=Elysia chlorotica TaxID=188477 RepID=A0A3S0ZY39_ELYCH|nr:hypothetical protein EGW08_002663 [Elysia chlorotica]
MSDVCNFLLTTTSPVKHQYVCLGFFQQDDLEQHFGYFRMSAGCNYYITVEEVFNAHAMDQARLMLKTNPDVDIYSNNKHACDLCEKSLTDSELIILDDMAEGQLNVSLDEKQSVFYIAGYIAFRNPGLIGTPSETESNVQSFLAELNRGSLAYPSNQLYTLSLLTYSFFKSTSERFCRNRLMSIMSQFPGIFHLDLTVPRDAMQRLANTLMKRLSVDIDQEASDPARKYSKLSASSSKSK